MPSPSTSPMSTAVHPKFWDGWVPSIVRIDVCARTAGIAASAKTREEARAAVRIRKFIPYLLPGSGPDYLRSPIPASWDGLAIWRNRPRFGTVVSDARSGLPLALGPGRRRLDRRSLAVRVAAA